ncbi:MAG: glutamine synthetase, partial [Pseudomonadota bacterium]
YLLFATVLGGALLGIEDTLDPGAPTEGNAYQSKAQALASSWENAVTAFERSEFMARVLPEELIDQFVRTKRQEIARLKGLSQSEKRQLYFDRV